MPSPRPSHRPLSRPAPKARSLPVDISARQLADCEFFSGFPEAARRKILALSGLRNLEAGATLFEEGQACQALHLLLAGDVKMHKLSAEGKEQVIRRLKPGQIFGAAPLFTPQGSYPATAVALAPSVVLFVPKADLIRFLKEEPDRFLKVLAFVSQHLQEMMRLAESVSLDRVPKRLATLLLALAKDQGGPQPGQALRLPHSQAEMAAELGTVREVVGRTLHQFQKQGLLQVAGRRIVLRDIDGLGAV